MALVKCKQCGTEVATDAKACPKCASPNFKGGWTKNPTLNSGCGVALLLLFGYCGVKTCGSGGGGGDLAGAANKSMAKALLDSAKPTARGPAQMTVDNRKLWADYQANEVAADNVYRGKRMKVTGTVASIDKNAFDQIVVHLASPNEFMNTMAGVEEAEAAKAASLSKGTKVTLLCTGEGLLVGSPSIGDCTFVE